MAFERAEDARSGLGAAGYGGLLAGPALGYGRERTGRVGAEDGVQCLSVADGCGCAFWRGGDGARRVGKTYPIACTQDHWSMEGRPIVREANLEQFRQKPSFAKAMNAEEPPGAGAAVSEPAG